MLPNSIKESIDRYVLQEVLPGGFLYSVLANDLYAAVTSANDDNEQNLGSICRYVADATPAACHGTYANVVE